MIFSVGSLAASTPYLGAILAVIVTGWLGAARRLSTQFDSAMAANEAAIRRKELAKAREREEREREARVSR